MSAVAKSLPIEPSLGAQIPAGTPQYRRFLGGMCAAGIATFAQLYAPQGLLPLIARDLNASSTDAALTMSAATIGLAVALLPWSFVAIRVGPLTAMRASLIAATLLSGCVAFAPNLQVLLVLRFLIGIALGGLPAIAMTHLHRELQPRATAAAGAAYIAGTTIGGALGRLAAGGAADAVGWRMALLAITVLCAATAVAFVLLIRPGRPAPREEVTLKATLRGLSVSLRDPTLRVLYVLPFLLMGSFVAMYNYLGFRLVGPGFHLPAALASLIFLTYLAGTLTSALTGSWVPRYGRRRTAIVGMLVMLVGAALTIDGHLLVVVVGLTVFTGGYFTVHATVSGWVAAHAKVGRAQATALYNITQYIGAAVIGWVLGYLADLGWTAIAGAILTLVAIAAVTAMIGTREQEPDLTARPSVATVAGDAA